MSKITLKVGKRVTSAENKDPSMPLLKPFAALVVLAALGASSLLLVVEDIIARLPEGVVAEAGGPAVLTALMLVQPTILSCVAIAVGLALAHRVSLRSILVDRLRGLETSGPTSSFTTVALIGGLAAGFIIVGGDLLFAPWTDEALSSASVAPDKRLPALAFGVLYGGITEEILLRWGLMSLVAWFLTRIGVQPGVAVALGMLVSALIFAVAHLPALAAAVPLDAPLIARTILINAGAGIVFGMAYARHSLEAAMVAHAVAHVILFIARLGGLAY